jgi:cytochrome c
MIPDRGKANITLFRALRMKIAIALSLAIAALSANFARAADGDPIKGAVVFKKCLACHRIGLGAVVAVGPPLNGIVGRKAGTFVDYPYSEAMRASGLTFDEATLAAYLRSPKAIVPGGSMAFAGLKRDNEIVDVIAYLKSFAADGGPAPSPAN